MVASSYLARRTTSKLSMGTATRSQLSRRRRSSMTKVRTSLIPWISSSHKHSLCILKARLVIFRLLQWTLTLLLMLLIPSLLLLRRDSKFLAWTRRVLKVGSIWACQKSLASVLNCFKTKWSRISLWQEQRWARFSPTLLSSRLMLQLKVQVQMTTRQGRKSE